MDGTDTVAPGGGWPYAVTPDHEGVPFAGCEELVAYGHAGRVALHEALGPGEQTALPVDAAVVAIIDQVQVDRAALGEALGANPDPNP